MENDAVKALIEQAFPGDTVTVTGDGSHFDAIVVSNTFEGMSAVKRQQAVYASVTDQITSGELHAFGIKAHTPDEWAKAQKLSIG
ncbi:MAG: BolA family transcriptional regulator [Methylococcales bacterium]|jgi:acid stress-induced BolA-like protein IbaG/YrbA|nr:BolA family transcriptional regulator [Methylococcales bacterium]